MRIPNVSERMKEAPAHALRAMFAGIGQALLISDRMRRRLRGRQAPETASHTVKVPVGTTEATTRPSEVPVGRPGTETATPTPSATTPPATQPSPTKPVPGAEVAAVGKATAPGSAEKTTAKPPPAAGKPEPAAAPAAGKPEPASGGGRTSELPIPNYDQLSIPSLRARLRGLNAAQVRQLMTYEKAHSGRSDVITMYERRIEKLTEMGG